MILKNITTTLMAVMITKILSLIFGLYQTYWGFLIKNSEKNKNQ